MLDGSAGPCYFVRVMLCTAANDQSKRAPLRPQLLALLYRL